MPYYEQYSAGTVTGGTGSTLASKVYNNECKTSALNLMKENVLGNISLYHDTTTKTDTSYDIMRLEAKGRYTDSTNSVIVQQEGQIHLDSDTIHSKNTFNRFSTYMGGNLTGEETKIKHGETEVIILDASIEQKLGSVTLADGSTIVDKVSVKLDVTTPNIISKIETYDGSSTYSDRVKATLTDINYDVEVEQIDSSNGVKKSSSMKLGQNMLTLKSMDDTVTGESTEVKLELESSATSGSATLTATNTIELKSGTTVDLTIDETLGHIFTTDVNIKESDFQLGTVGTPVLEYNQLVNGSIAAKTLNIDTASNTVNIDFTVPVATEVLPTVAAVSGVANLQNLVKAVTHHFDTVTSQKVSNHVTKIALDDDLGGPPMEEFDTYLNLYGNTLGLPAAENAIKYPLEARQIGPILYVLSKRISAITGGQTPEWLDSISELAAELQVQALNGEGGLLLLDELNSLRKHVSLLAAKIDTLTSNYDEFDYDNLQETLLFPTTNFISYKNTSDLFGQKVYSSIDDGVFYGYQGLGLSTGGIVPDNTNYITDNFKTTFYYNGDNHNGFFQDTIQNTWGFCKGLQLVSQHWDNSALENGAMAEDMTDDYIPDERVFSTYFTSETNITNSLKYPVARKLKIEDDATGEVIFDPFYGIQAQNGIITAAAQVTDTRTLTEVTGIQVIEAYDVSYAFNIYYDILLTLAELHGASFTDIFNTSSGVDIVVPATNQLPTSYFDFEVLQGGPSDTGNIFELYMNVQFELTTDKVIEAAVPRYSADTNITDYYTAVKEHFKNQGILPIVAFADSTNVHLTDNLELNTEWPVSYEDFIAVTMKGTFETLVGLGGREHIVVEISKYIDDSATVMVPLLDYSYDNDDGKLKRLSEPVFNADTVFYTVTLESGSDIVNYYSKGYKIESDTDSAQFLRFLQGAIEYTGATKLTEITAQPVSSEVVTQEFTSTTSKVHSVHHNKYVTIVTTQNSY